MKNRLALGLLLLTLAASAGIADERSLSSPRFGAVTVYGNAASPRTFILFVSGAEGWTAVDTEAARALVRLGYMVAGIDLRTYFKSLAQSRESCALAALDLEGLSELIQNKLGFTGLTPVLAGTAAGASLVYAAAAQARPGVFLGAVSLGFCPRLDIPVPLCRGNGLMEKEDPGGKAVTLLPCPTLDTAWIAISGRPDRVYSIESVRTFVSLTRFSQLIELPGVGHELKPFEFWLPRFNLALRTLAYLSLAQKPAVPEKLEDLPLIKVPSPRSSSDILVIDITGDGGYSATDRGISEGLAQAGYAAIALNSLKYFWTKKTPEVAAQDLDRILRHYLSEWKKSEVVIVGYSLGADVAPFMINRLPEDLKRRVKLLALLGPSLTVDFEFHLMDWMVSKTRPGDLPVLPEILKLDGMRLLCFYGDQDKGNICNRLPTRNLRSMSIPSRHRFGRNYERVLTVILEEVKKLENHS